MFMYISCFTSRNRSINIFLLPGFLNHDLSGGTINEYFSGGFNLCERRVAHWPPPPFYF